MLFYPYNGGLGSTKISVVGKEVEILKVEFTVPGKPKGKGRPKFARRGMFTTTYTPKPTVQYEKEVKISYNKANRGTVLNGPLSVEILGVFPVPKSVSKKKHREMIGTPHVKKPDCDNVAKIILDPLNRLAFHDDGQVSRLSIDKVYGEDARVEVTIKELQPVIKPAIYFLDEKENNKS